MHESFGGLRFFSHLGDLFISPRQKKELTDRAWNMSTDLFLRNPDLARVSNSEATENESINLHDRRSKTLLVGDTNTFIAKCFEA